MSLYFSVEPAQLRAALAEIEAAEKNGFEHCLAVFYIAEADRCLDKTKAQYSDLIERAHPTDTSLDYGRGQCVTKECKFVRGKLVEIKIKPPEKKRNAQARRRKGS